MQPAQTEKIKKLIYNSGILTAEERAEWLALLGIMNDKQILELERILSSHDHDFSAAPTAKHGAPLQHIVNLPQSVSGQLPHLSEPATHHEKEKGKDFAREVREIVNEKELPTSKPEFPLGITGRTAQSSTTELHKKAEPNPVVLPPIKSSIPLSSFVKPTQPAKPIVTPPVSVKASEGAAPAKEDAIFHAELHSWDDIERFVKKTSVPPQGATNTPGAVFSKVLQAQSGAGSFARSSVPQGAEPAAAASPPRTAWTEEDPSKLTITIFQKVDLQDIIQRIRELVKRRGYHPVLFELEKSPLYQMYIETGSKILSGDNSFEKIGKDGGVAGKRYLGRKEFENFTDLLRQIQIS